MNPPPGIEVLPNGQYVIQGDTHLSAWAKEKGTIVTDPYLFKFLRPHVGHSKVIWDIGACIGDHTRQYLDWGAEVVAFEPNPVAFACLEHNCSEARLYNIAASDKTGPLMFTHLDNAGASRIQADGEWSVQGFALDDVQGLPAPDFVKCDIEGHEPLAIAGMAGTITRYKPIIFIEMNAGALAASGFTVEGLRDLIRSLGYTREIIYPEGAKFGEPQFDILFKP